MNTQATPMDGVEPKQPLPESTAFSTQVPNMNASSSDASKTTTNVLADAESKVPTNTQDAQGQSKTGVMESTPPSLSATLRSQIEALLALQARMTVLRSIPARMLRLQIQSSHSSLLGGVPQLAGSGAAAVGLRLTGSDTSIPSGSQGAQIREALETLTSIREQLLKNDLQAALRAARESEAKDPLEVVMQGRKRRKRITTADSPAAFPSFQIQPIKVFPPKNPAYGVELTRNTLPQFIRDSNKSRNGNMRLHIWMRSRPKSGSTHSLDVQSGLIILRVTLSNVATIYVKLNDRNDTDDSLTVESVVAFGPREKKGPHSQSEYVVYQKLTQQISRMLRHEPYASLHQVLDLLVSYEGLFVTQCSKCERILSQEGHVPPVGRVWKDGTGDSGEIGRWEARHITCLNA